MSLIPPDALTCMPASLTVLNIKATSSAFENDRVNLPLEKKVKLYSILVENMDMLYRPVDLGLFMDKLYYDIRKAVI